MHQDRRIFLVLTAALLVTTSVAQNPSTGSADAAAFAPFQQWMGAVLTSDTATLKGLYSTNPAAQIRIKTVMHPADADINFWLDQKVRSMQVEIVRLVLRPDRASVIFRADVVPGVPNGQPFKVTDDQYWVKQSDQWRLLGVERTDAPKLQQPADMKRDLYPANADAHAEIKGAEEKAAKEHKRLLLVFGANWCFDCHVLDLAFHGPELAPIIATGYEVVHVDIGPDGKKNGDVAKQFDVSLDKGVPTLAVIESDGRVVVSEKNGEFEDARQLTPEYLAEFLNKWKPK
ncbi:MAG TPA: thioredoxin family protein [Candidatus Sulfotelmatobacter sp.]|nr:thioredoxin family protein [Candidatus Sulfotelmatobacter sp.]